MPHSPWDKLPKAGSTLALLIAFVLGLLLLVAGTLRVPSASSRSRHAPRAVRPNTKLLGQGGR
ncbi:MAG TPA: hypothetical protein VG406_07800, partial [Isosphaeraceae bacterium]|nr:hypothetical protein [Isosphaeraceae bacterium]